MASRSVRASGSCGVRPGGVGAGKGRRPAGQVFFHVPVRPGISMNLGKNCFRRAFNNFKFHLHGLKRYVKKHLPRRPPPFPSPNARPGLTPQEPLALTEEVAASYCTFFSGKKRRMRKVWVCSEILRMING